jgi:hypothetical protein
MEPSMRQPKVVLLSLCALVLCSGCFWGETDAAAFFKISAGNYANYEGLLFPEERADAWSTIFEARPSLCVGGSDDSCAGGDFERSDLLDLYLPYKTNKVRGLQTQKDDLQITSHFDVADAYALHVEAGFEDLAYLMDEDELYGRQGDGCEIEGIDAADRTGVGPCLRNELMDNQVAYRSLKEDLRLVILINLPGVDDVRTTACQDRPQTFASSDWSYPRTLRVNYNAAQPVESGSDMVYGDPEEDPPLAACDIEVFAQLQLGFERFGADYYGQDDEGGGLTLDRVNEDGQTLVGTVEVESLLLPGEGYNYGRVVGRYNLRFTADRFAPRDGTVEIAGKFNAEIHPDPVEVVEPERELDLTIDDDPTAR